MTDLKSSTPISEVQDEEKTDVDSPAFGWNSYAELVNGRVAMLAIVGLVVLEWFSKQDLFTWLGLR